MFDPGKRPDFSGAMGKVFAWMGFIYRNVFLTIEFFSFLILLPCIFMGLLLIYAFGMLVSCN